MHRPGRAEPSLSARRTPTRVRRRVAGAPRSQVSQRLTSDSPHADGGIVWPVETPTASKDAMAVDDARGQAPSVPHEDLPADPRAAHAAFRSAVRLRDGGRDRVDCCFGYDISTTNRAVKALQADFHIGNALLGFAAASVVLGAAVGAVWAGRIGDRLGRLSMMKLAAGIVLRVRGSALVWQPAFGCSSSSTSSAVLGSASHRLRLRPTSPKSHPRASVAGLAHCSSLPSCVASSAQWR